MTRAKRLALVAGLGLLALTFLYAAATGGYGYGYYRLVYLGLAGVAGYAARYFYRYGENA